MQINEYQSLAMRTANQSLAQESQLINAALGLCGEAGEFADLIKKVNYQGHDKDQTHLVKELGDICLGGYSSECRSGVGNGYQH